MDSVRKIHETDSVEDVESFLESATGGATREEFRANSRQGKGKSHEQLLHEIQEECVIVYIDPKDRVAVRAAASVKGIIYDSANEMLLVEIGRRNEKKDLDGNPLLDDTGEPILGNLILNYNNSVMEIIRNCSPITLETLLQVWSFSETRKKDETHEQGLVRGAKEELDIVINVGLLNAKRKKRVWTLGTDEDVHWSKSYPGVRTREFRTWLMVEAHLLSPRFIGHMARIRRRRDNGVYIHYAWFQVSRALMQEYKEFRATQPQFTYVPSTSAPEPPWSGMSF